MNDDYLWEGRGPADPVVRQLEETLAPLRHDPNETPTLRRRRPASLRAAAAAILIAAGIGVVFLARGSLRGAGGWPVTVLSGTSTTDALAVGGWLETDALTSLEVDVADIGTVTVHPNSRLKLLVSDHDLQHRLELAEGTIDAFIIAPPRLFIVDTPSASAVDLGCAYELTVDEEGNGELDVTLGSVALERDGREATIPAGARCLLRAGVGPGTPFFPDSPRELRSELERLDFEARGDAKALAAVLGAARERDTLTLWHLLTSVNADQRGEVIERIQTLAPGVGDTEALMRLDPDAMQAAWEELEVQW